MEKIIMKIADVDMYKGWRPKKNSFIISSFEGRELRNVVLTFLLTHQRRRDGVERERNGEKKKRVESCNLAVRE